jgi:hypothetical protein
VATKQKIPTPLDYVHFLAGLPSPMEEPDPIIMPVQTPVYLPNPQPQTLDQNAFAGMQGGAPQVPPPIAPEAPPDFGGGGGFF